MTCREGVEAWGIRGVALSTKRANPARDRGTIATQFGSLNALEGKTAAPAVERVHYFNESLVEPARYNFDFTGMRRVYLREPPAWRLTTTFSF